MGVQGEWDPSPEPAMRYPWAEPQWDHLSLMSLMRITTLMRVCWANEVNELRQANEVQRV